jgi:hypothetical protein
MKKEKIHCFVLFLFCVIFFITSPISNAQDFGEEKLGKIRGWIVDPETGKPVNEPFAVIIYDDKELIDLYSYINVLYSNVDGYFEGFLKEGTYQLYVSPKNFSSRFSKTAPLFLRDSKYKCFFKVDKGKTTEIRKKASIGGRLRINIVDSSSTRVDFQSKFNLAKLSLIAYIKSPNLREKIELSGLGSDTLDDGEMLSDAIFPGIYTLQVKLSGVDFGNRLYELDCVKVISGNITTANVIIDLNNDTGFDGFITGGGGEPIKGALVSFTEIANVTSEKYILMSHTNKDGYYKYIGLRDGQYRVKISASKYSSQNIIWETKQNVTLRKDFELIPICIE